MQQRTLGSTDLPVSPVGLGLAALGRPGYINLGHDEDLARNYDVEAMEERTHRVLDTAWAAGVRYFDAARSYGLAEAFLGSWLRGRELTEPLTVGSKWGYTYTADWQVEADTHEVKEHSLPVLTRQWKESREHLGAHLGLYQIHSATLESGVLENADVLKELERLKDEGVRIGLSLSGPRQAETLHKALTVERNGARLFDAVQATFNLLERSAGDALAEAHGAGLGVIVKEALANGRLTERNDANAFAGGLERLREQAERLGTTVDALALAFVLARPWADVVLSGAATEAHLRSNLRATAVAWDDEADAALASLGETAGVYWGTRGELPWR